MNNLLAFLAPAICVFMYYVTVVLVARTWNWIKKSRQKNPNTSSFPRGWASQYMNYSDKEWLELDMDQLTTFWIEDGTDASFYEWMEKVREARKVNKDVVPPTYDQNKLLGNFHQLLQPGLQQYYRPETDEVMMLKAQQNKLPPS